jgi:hypothetical protein
MGLVCQRGKKKKAYWFGKPSDGPWVKSRTGLKRFPGPVSIFSFFLLFLFLFSLLIHNLCILDPN